MKSTVLWKGRSHQWVVLGRDAEKRSDLIDTNQFAIVAPGHAMLVDPGGIEIFPRVLSELARHVRTDDVRVIFSSHQDPDVISSLAMWLDLCPGARLHCSWLWTSFISHYCMGTAAAFEAIPDEGATIRLGQTGPRFEAIPAHFCHSPGNFALFDPEARILFSSDIGAALLPSHESGLFVEDFERHVPLMEGFHRRWMPSTAALRRFAQRARALEPSMIAPQHGSIFQGDDVGRFLDWLERLEVGITREDTTERASAA